MKDISGALKRDLGRRLGTDAIVEDFAERFRAARDWWSAGLWWDRERAARHAPAAIVRPVNLEGLCRILFWADSNGVALVARGGGSGVCGAAVPNDGESIVVETTALNKIIRLETQSDAASVTVEAGMLGGDLEAAVNRQGYALMHVPASLDISTVGGWIATGSYGQLSTLYGGIGDQIQSLQAVFPGGAVETAAPKSMLLSEGGLGIISQATLRLRPKPAGHFFLSAEFENMEDPLALLRDLMGRGIRPEVARLYDPLEARTSLSAGRRSFLSDQLKLKLTRFALRYPALLRRLQTNPWAAKRWLLVLIFEETRHGDYLESRRLLEGMKIKSDEAPARLWLANRFQWNTGKVSALFDQGCFADSLDAWAPWQSLPELYRRLIESVSPRAAAMAHVSHADPEGACLYLLFAGRGKSRPESARLHQDVWRLAMEACISAGARVNHHHGVGLAKREWRQHAYRPGWLSEFAQLKRSRDPKDIMNPGKVL